MTLTNGSAGATEQLLDRSGLGRYVEQIPSCDQVEAFKPHPAPYQLAMRSFAGQATMVAAHGWDIVGARRAGLHTLWIDREERLWPFPFDEPRRARALAMAAQMLIQGRT